MWSVYLFLKVITLQKAFSELFLKLKEQFYLNQLDHFGQISYLLFNVLNYGKMLIAIAD
jgi:hypothetical protein